MLFNEEILNKLNTKNILLGVSGGVDSIVMLDLFTKFRYTYELNLEIAHFNHYTRQGQSDIDQEFVESLGHMYGLKVHTKKASMEQFAVENNLSTEDAGRILRKRFFKEIIDSKEDQWYIALAHNINDQVETILMRIIRGTGIDGLMVMNEIDGDVIRPLLQASKQDIISYARINKLAFAQDQSNFENKYLRNKIRNELLPLLREKYNPNIDQALLNLSKLASNQNSMISSYVDQLASSVIRKKSIFKTVFNKHKLLTFHENEILALIRSEIARIDSNYDFTNNHYTEILKVLKSSKKAITNLNGLTFYNSFSNFIVRMEKENDLRVDLIIKEDKDLILNDYHILIKNPKGYLLKVRSRKNGDRICINNKEKKLKDFLIDKKIDTYDRDFLPIIELNDKIINVANIYNHQVDDLHINIRSLDE